MLLRPIILPAGWFQLESPVFDTEAYYWKRNRVKVLIGPESHNKETWVHVSLSKPNKLPTWAEVREVKNIFIGRKEKAIMILPCDDEYVNIHPYCLHLWCNLNQDVLPDFTRGTGMI